MSYYGEAIDAHLRGLALPVVFLARIGFTTGEVRLWNGKGRVELGGEIWDGSDAWGSISNLESGGSDTAPEVMLSLSGVDEGIARYARRDAPVVRGAPVKIYEVYFHPQTWQQLGAPVQVYDGIADRVSVAQKATAYTVTLHVEGPFVDRSKPADGLLTDLSQQRRFPGDLGLAFQAECVSKVIEWPIF